MIDKDTAKADIFARYDEEMRRANAALKAHFDRDESDELMTMITIHADESRRLKAKHDMLEGLLYLRGRKA